MAEALRYVHSRSDFYGFNCYFRTFITSIMLFGGMKWAKKLKTKNGQNMSSGPFSHDAVQLLQVEKQEPTALVVG